MMKTNRLFWLLWAAPLALGPLSGGCMLLTAPPPEATPTPAPTPKAPYFKPADGLPVPPLGTALNKLSDPVLPDAFRIASPTTGDHVALQSIDKVTTGTPPKEVTAIGPPDTVRLAGIVAPTGEPGLQGAKNAISNWTKGQDLDVLVDSRYPMDLDGKKIVHITFKGGHGPYEGQIMSLNRMLVRSGWAVVDLYSPTSFDTSQWLYDEAYARKNKLGFWKFGIAIQQRIPVSITQLHTVGGQSKVTIQTARPGDVPVNTVTGVAPVPGAPVPGAPVPGSPVPGSPVPGAPVPAAPPAAGAPPASVAPKTP